MYSEKLMPGPGAQGATTSGAHQIAGQVQQQVQHTVHELDPLTRYSMRVTAVNALGRSRPSVALSLRTEEEGESIWRLWAPPQEAPNLSTISLA